MATGVGSVSLVVLVTRHQRLGDAAFGDLGVGELDGHRELALVGRRRLGGVEADGHRVGHLAAADHLQLDGVLLALGHQFAEVGQLDGALLAVAEGDRGADGVAVDDELDAAGGLGPGAELVVRDDGPQGEHRALRAAEAAGLAALGQVLHGVLDGAGVGGVAQPGEHGERGRLNRQRVAAAADHGFGAAADRAVLGLLGDELVHQELALGLVAGEHHHVGGLGERRSCWRSSPRRP